MPEYLAQLPTVRGIPWPSFCDDWETRLDGILNFDPRPDDIFVISYPKCGHHWSYEFLSMIIQGELEIPKATNLDNFLEFLPMEVINDKPSPRLILTHVPFDSLPKKILEKRSKIIRITRNPKDVCVSFYNHTRAIKKYNISASLSEFHEYFLAGDVEYGSFFEFERRYKAELGGEDRKDHIIHTSYETLKKDPHAAIKQLGEFLGYERSDDFYNAVVEKTSFQKIKAKRDEDYKKNIVAGRSMYFKGQVGYWINHLTVQQSRRIDQLVEANGLEFVYEQ